MLIAGDIDDLDFVESDSEDPDLLIDEDDDDDDDETPVRASSRVVGYDRRRRRAGRTGVPEFDLGASAPSGRDIPSLSPRGELRRIGSLSMKESDIFLDDYLNKKLSQTSKFNNEMRSVIKNLRSKISNNGSVLLNESDVDESDSGD